MNGPRRQSQEERTELKIKSQEDECAEKTEPRRQSRAEKTAEKTEKSRGKRAEKMSGPRKQKQKIYPFSWCE